MKKMQWAACSTVNSQRYGASFIATALKWLEITDEAAMLVVARDGFVCWSYPSTLASRRGGYLRPGTAVPQSAIDRLSGATKLLRNQVIRVQPGVWHPTMEADEAVIVSDQFELALFLISFPAARTVEHLDEQDDDAVTFMEGQSHGLNWMK